PDDENPEWTAEDPARAFRGPPWEHPSFIARNRLHEALSALETSRPDVPRNDAAIAAIREALRSLEGDAA
ncbi:MAG: hypothetical protein AAFU61_13275, partial [Pseudomonadota bacterium]